MLFSLMHLFFIMVQLSWKPNPKNIIFLLHSRFEFIRPRGNVLAELGIFLNFTQNTIKVFVSAAFMFLHACVLSLLNLVPGNISWLPLKVVVAFE